MSETLGSRITFGIVAGIARPLLNVLLSKRWEGFEHQPTGGYIACPNHLTEIDPLVVGHAVYGAGRLPRFLAKESLFKIPVVGMVLRKTRQIPVARSSKGANASLQAAQELISNDGVAIVYPEGTLTRDPDLWPMRGRTGAARLALQTGAPVVPVAHWGAQELLPRYAKKLHVFPRKRVVVRMGPPVDLEDLRGKPLTKTVLLEATDRIMRAVSAEMESLRGETAPAELWDPAAQGQKLTGRDFESGPSGAAPQ
ncbi:lysophospholipid acyltransferase family protein [Zhihengliuella flava]|uniref:1-acyl-sn-glycerol-3-phosphate acyltransferase n=1 Tax=Zhihengliuella flava TaxID=1285193 RepID=A0A931D7S2_9MICC|nr:lysophospholipid acyltransferase family protein [Zhihengliuella flava]MBG6083563.1 1-acyl-sn-glycerol-3-phosphate acyltransferase [Zhihengliuella flava]